MEARRIFAGISWLSIPRKEAYALHMTGMRRVSIGWRKLCLASISQVRPSRETPAKHFVLRENSSKNTRELEIFIPTILYTFVCGISSSPTSPFLYHWEVDSTNTYHTLWECQVRFWCCWEALEEAKDGKCNIELVAGSGVLDKTQFREALLE